MDSQFWLGLLIWAFLGAGFYYIHRLIVRGE